MSSGTVISSGPAVAGSVPAARRLVRETLLARGMPQLVDSVELLASELVGNVVLHVGGTVTVALTITGSDVLLEVSDESPVAPQLRTYSRTSSTGRGVRLVQSLSAEHGVRLQEGGKTVWARFDLTCADRDEERLAMAFADIDWLEEPDADPVRPARGAATACATGTRRSRRLLILA